MCSSEYYPVTSVINSNYKLCRCALGKYLYKGVCETACPTGSFAASTTDFRVCIPCSVGCASCSGYGTCDACKTGF